MIDKIAARSIAWTEINKPNPDGSAMVDLVLLDQETIEKEYGWIFFYQSRHYIETGDEQYALPYSWHYIETEDDPYDEPRVRNSSLLVLKASGEIILFSADYPVAGHIHAYESSLAIGPIKLIILRVYDMDKTVSYLARLRLSIVMPQLTCEGESPSPQFLTSEQIKSVLQNLPAVFENVDFSRNLGNFNEMFRSGCCDYDADFEWGNFDNSKFNNRSQNLPQGPMIVPKRVPIV